ncbi:MAG: galactokinase [Bacteroidota bacterium]|nr:galactokinase [Bacteroidota bacterium]
MNIQTLRKTFLKRFGKPEEELKVYFAPGRVNLIGEHTDYNGGYVLPCALSYGTYLLIRKTGNENISFASENFDYTLDSTLENVCKQSAGAWVNYPLGVIQQFRKEGKEIQGLEFLYAGDIPLASGLSSSASIELVTAFALNDIFSFGMKKAELARLSQKAEHDFVGVHCGIMDQYAVALGHKEHALFLNCKTLNFVHVPVKLGDYKLVIVNSNKPRGLADSAYNERVNECREAVENIRKGRNIDDLGQLRLEDFRQVEHLIRHPDVRKRAYHVVNENYRVLESVKALKFNKIDVLGKLMNASHKSLRDYYEVTGPELDALAEIAWEIQGVLGARMTGAGFGGCTVNLVHQEKLETFKETLAREYARKTGLEASFYLPEIGGGVNRIKD